MQAGSDFFCTLVWKTMKVSARLVGNCKPHECVGKSKQGRICANMQEHGQVSKTCTLAAEGAIETIEPQDRPADHDHLIPSACPFSIRCTLFDMSQRAEAKHTASKYDFVKVHCVVPMWIFRHAQCDGASCPCRSRSGWAKG